MRRELGGGEKTKKFKWGHSVIDTGKAVTGPVNSQRGFSGGEINPAVELGEEKYKW